MNKIVPGGVEEQALKALENMRAIVEAAGSSLNKVAKTTVLIFSTPLMDAWF